jgi:hypothetical protein
MMAALPASVIGGSASDPQTAALSGSNYKAPALPGDSYYKVVLFAFALSLFHHMKAIFRMSAMRCQLGPVFS